MARTRQAVKREPVPNAQVSAGRGPAETQDKPIDAIVGDSPARQLRQRVENAFAPSDERWSPRRTLAFIVLVCGAFWAAVVAVAFKLG